MYESRAIKIFPLQDKNARIYLEYRYIGKYCHPACCATFTVPRIFQWIPWNLSSCFPSFPLYFFFASRKTVKGVYLDPSDAAFPRRCPDKPSRIVSTFQARDVIPILGRCVCQSKHFRNFIRCAFNYPWSCVRVSRMKGPEWNIDTLYVSRVERFNAPLMDTALYIYTERTREEWEFECLIERFRRAKCYINIYIFGNWNIFSRNYIREFLTTSTNECFTVHSRNIIGSEARRVFQIFQQPEIDGMLINSLRSRPFYFDFSVNF